MIIKHFRYFAPVGDLDNIDTSGPGDHDPSADRGDKIPKDNGETDDARAEREALERVRDSRKGAESDDKDDDKGAGKDEPKGEKVENDPLRGKGEKVEKTEKTEKDDDDKKGVIPRDRHEKVLSNERAKREQVERELAAYKGAEKIVKSNEKIEGLEKQVDDLDEQYAKALADGDTSKARDLSRQIRIIERQIATESTNVAVAAAEARTAEAVRYDTALERIEEAFPKLNSDHEDFDPELATDVGDLMMVYRGRGMTPTKALQQAVEKLVKPATAKQSDAVTVTPRGDKKDDAADPDKVKADRKAAAVDKAVDAHKRTPPPTDTVGKNSDSLGGGLNSKDVASSTYDQFSKLTEEDLARVRGDII